MDTSQITGLKYNIEPIDHLYRIYGEFGRRNNVNEWIYFLRRPELAGEHEFSEIAEHLLQCMVRYGNISQEIVKIIEKSFGFEYEREKYEKVVGYDGMETYCQYMLKNREFPPYEFFEEYDDTKDYDSFIYEFRDMFFNYRTDDAAEYHQRLDKLKEMGIEHPYIAFLESEYYALCGEWETAIRSLDSIEDCYYKFLKRGLLFSRIGVFDLAEACYEKAMEIRSQNLDPALIEEYLISKWNGGKEGEALIAAGKFEEAGYEYVVLPVKQMFLTELGKTIMEKSEKQEISEGDLLILKEMYKSYNDYENIINIINYSWERGFENECWTIDIAEAYFENGDFEEAQKIVDMVYDGRKKLTSTGMLKIREIKARLLFEEGRIGDAYEIMENICKRPECTVSQKYNLAKMYLITGKYKSASKLFDELRYESSGNLFYTYDMARCYMKMEIYNKAMYLFMEIYSKIPEFGRAAYHIVECAVELQDIGEVKSAMNIVKENLSYYEIRYFNGIMMEMEGDFKKAREIYKKLIDDYEIDVFSEEFLYEIYLRYFLMVAETNGRVGSMIRDIENVLAAYPKAVHLWDYLAEFHEITEYMEENIEKCCKMALKADPFDVQAIMRLVSICIDKEDMKTVWELSNRLIECTDLPEGYLLRAQSGYDIGKVDQCMSDLNKYEQMGGDKNEILDTRATIAMSLGEYEEAYKCYEEKLKNKKVSEIPCYDDMALCLCKLGKYGEAMKTLDTACENSRIGTHHDILYKIQMYIGDFSGAGKTLKRYSKVCNINKFMDDDYLIMSAWLATEAGNGLKAQTIAESIASREGERLCAIHEMLYMNFKKAAKMFKKLVKKEPNEIDNYSWCALALNLCGNKAEAEACATQGIAVFKEQYGDIQDIKLPYYLCQYAFLKVMCSKCEEAVHIFEHALEVPTCRNYPCSECYEAHYGLGINHLVHGNRYDAKIEFDKALEIKQANIVCRKMRELV